MAPHLFVLMIKSQLENGVSQAGMEAVPAVNEALLFFHDCKTIFLSIFGHTLKNSGVGENFFQFSEICKNKVFLQKSLPKFKKIQIGM